MNNFPWDGLIPEEDLAAFAVRQRPAVREMATGVRPALIIVDMTREFVDSAYPTGWSPTGVPAAAANRTLLEAARRSKIPIFYTNHLVADMANALPAQKGPTPWKNTRIDRDPSLPNGNVIADTISPIPGEIVIGKLKPSGFHGTPLETLLNFYGIDTLIVTGMVTSGCVRATVIDAYMLSYRVIVPLQCVADWSPFQHKASLFDMHMKYADVAELSEVVAYLGRIESPSSETNEKEPAHLG